VIVSTMRDETPMLLREMEFERQWKVLIRAVAPAERVDLLFDRLAKRWARDGKLIREIVEGILKCQR
jgi:hypothetical protein